MVLEPAAAAIATPDLSRGELAIGRANCSATAFVGRTLRGPLNRPTHVASFAEFQQVFGGLWQPSPLSYAIEQFFDNGGRDAIIVRVMNGGAPPTIDMPCGDEFLTLRALSCGSREFLRASVDYDNINDAEDDRFNLVVQRLRTPGTERIETQESFRAVSISPTATRYVGTVLRDSQLVSLEGTAPRLRPEKTLRSGVTHPIGYIASNPDGDDGGELSDYDVIGSVDQHSGIFALDRFEDIGFLYIPPLARDTEIGASTLLIAGRFCRERRVILIVDPPIAWQSTDDAVRGLRDMNFSSDHAVMFFPRVCATDRLRARTEQFANGGAVAGMLARADEHYPVYALHEPVPELFLRAGTRPTISLSERDRWRLANQGINPLTSIRSANPVRLVPRTLAGGANASAEWAYLYPRRFACMVVNSIERSTRGCAGQYIDRYAWKHVARAVTEFFDDLLLDGAFHGYPAEEAFFVACDERVNSDYDLTTGTLNVLVGFAGGRRGEYHSYLITHSAHATRVRSVAVNQLELQLSAEGVLPIKEHASNAATGIFERYRPLVADEA